MLQIIKSYFLFLLNSGNQHGVHSPFVFKLVTSCFYNKSKHSEYIILDQIRNSLLNNSNEIEVSDFGAGSRVFKSNRRIISKIASTAGITSKRTKLLYRITNYLQPKQILEIGTSVGLATPAFALGNPNAHITTLEGCPATSKVANESFYHFKLKNITVETTRFEDFFKTINPENKYDLIYFDGNHTYEATLEYFEALLPTICNDTVWIFDDIHWSTAMEKVWKEIIGHAKVTVSIDTFQWGIVFFRKEQEKEHFTIRV